MLFKRNIIMLEINASFFGLLEKTLWIGSSSLLPSWGLGAQFLLIPIFIARLVAYNQASPITLLQDHEDSINEGFDVD